MKKAFKIILTVAIVLLLGIGATVYYYLQVKEYDVADEKVEEITKSDYQIELPGIEDDGAVASESADGDGNAAVEASETTTDSGSSDKKVSSNSSAPAEDESGSDEDSGDSEKKVTEGQNKDGKSSSNKDNTKKTAITIESIKAAYRPVFESLESQANAKIDGLVSAAYGEYKAKKESGESVSFTYFYRKYTAAGQELESNTDETFHYVYNALEKDLKKHGLNASEATEFKTQYENAKKARQNALIEKAKSAL